MPKTNDALWGVTPEMLGADHSGKYVPPPTGELNALFDPYFRGRPVRDESLFEANYQHRKALAELRVAEAKLALLEHGVVLCSCRGVEGPRGHTLILDPHCAVHIYREVW